MEERSRCCWAGTDPLYVAYHDEEWGVPTRDDRRLFEMLLLEGAQAVALCVRLATGAEFPGWSIFAGPAIATLLWPLLSWLLLLPQRRPAALDERRPL